MKITCTVQFEYGRSIIKFGEIKGNFGSKKRDQLDFQLTQNQGGFMLSPSDFFPVLMLSILVVITIEFLRNVLESTYHYVAGHLEEVRKGKLFLLLLPCVLLGLIFWFFISQVLIILWPDFSDKNKLVYYFYPVGLTVVLYLVFLRAGLKKKARSEREKEKQQEC